MKAQDYCKQCGKCCTAIFIPITYRELFSKRFNNNPDALFIRKNWRPISKEKALTLNPQVQGLFTERQGASFYVCSRFNRKTKLCTAHNRSPRVCKQFPLYGNIIDSMTFLTLKLYSSSCGYHKLKSVGRLAQVIGATANRAEELPTNREIVESV